MNKEQIKMDIRTNGIGLPGLSVGWFKSNGEKYKLYVTDKEKVLYIPKFKHFHQLQVLEKVVLGVASDIR